MTASLHSAEAIGQAIKARLTARCRLTQGAETDIGVKLYLGRRRIDDTMIPCIALIEADDTPQRERVTDGYVIDQRYIAYAYLECDPDNPNVAAHAALRDLKRALWTTDDGKPEVRLGGAVRDLEYRGKDIGPRADGTAFVVAAMEFSVRFVEQMSNP